MDTSSLSGLPTANATQKEFSRVAEVAVFFRPDILAIIPRVTRLPVESDYAFGKTDDNQLVQLLEAKMRDHFVDGNLVRGETIELTMTARGVVLSINDQEVDASFAPQAIRSLHSLHPDESKYYSHYQPAPAG